MSKLNENRIKHTVKKVNKRRKKRNIHITERNGNGKQKKPFFFLENKINLSLKCKAKKEKTIEIKQKHKWKSSKIKLGRTKNGKKQQGQLLQRDSHENHKKLLRVKKKKRT